jgi:hypothetical protein
VHSSLFIHLFIASNRALTTQEIYMSASNSNKSIRSDRIILGALYPILIVLIGLGSYFSFYSDLPSLVTVHFDITRVPTTAVSKLTFGILMSILLVFSAVTCTFIAFSKRVLSIENHLTIVSYGGFLSAISACLMAGTVIIHRDLSHWQDATGPGFWLVAVVLAGISGRAVAIYLTRNIHRSNNQQLI